MRNRVRFFIVVLFWLMASRVQAQVVTTVPAFPVADQPVTIRVDVTGTSLNGFAWNNSTNPVYLWAWIERPGLPDFDAPTNINPATSAADAAKCTRISVNPDVYEITITPTTFFNKPANEIPQIGLKLKSRAWADNRQTDVDRFVTFSSGFAVQFTQPSETSFFVNTGATIPIVIDASQSATLTLKINGNVVASQANVTTLSYNHTVAETAGSGNVIVEAVKGSETKTATFVYTIRTATVNAPRPAGVKNGINYGVNPSEVTLSLWAPGNNSVYVIGDFTDWDIRAEFQMKKSGEYFWLPITGLTPGVEYGFQYLVDETIRVADPFADKILDPDDAFIPANTYPNLKPYPSKALSPTGTGYFNRVATLQTNQAPYPWQVQAFQKPAKEKLVIYELHIRDFFDGTNKNYQNLIDTIGYFKRLGINAIELMPITEFNGNDSWGYNPTFMFAPDKFYGTKNKLKEFIDTCHQNGIAVILDVVMNQQDTPNPFLLLDFNFATFKPNPTNKWFNVEATHPFNVFFDMNHESLYTQRYLDSVNHYWIKEYKFDGYRYDLSKGFTQVNSGSNVGLWSARDNSRIALLKRMYDKIRTYSTDSYLILEHFADNSEEKELAEYGFLMWANFSGQFSQNTMGFSSGSDISGIFHINRGWAVPHGIGYMESHDEERMMYRNLTSGNSSGPYNVRNLNVALERVKSASTIFYSIPGPRMLWQFGELGYDVSINEGGRTSAKPIRWNYYDDPERRKLFDHTAELVKLRNAYPIFSTSDVTLVGGASLQKQVLLKSVPFVPNPTNAQQMNVVALANFELAPRIFSINFPHTGRWFDYFSGTSVEVTTAAHSLDVMPGQSFLFTDVQLKTVVGFSDGDETDVFVAYPNPTEGFFMVNSNVNRIKVTDLFGRPCPVSRIGTGWSLQEASAGIYFISAEVDGRIVRTRLFKN